MDDLELNGTELPVGEPPKEPEQPPQEPVYQAQQPSFYAWSGTPEPRQVTAPPKKESPFANSPYVTVNASAEQPAAPVSPQPPRVPPKPKQKKSALPVISIIAGVAALCIALTTVIVSNGRMNDLKDDYDKRLKHYANQVQKLEDQLHAMTPGAPQYGTATGDEATRLPSAQGFMTPAQVYTQCVNSVVAIDCITAGRNGFGQYVEVPSSGSGFILSEDGYIVTNYHVVEGSSSIEISLYDGTTYKAEYIGGNEANDIALIKVDAKNLPPVEIGSSSDLIVGDQVAAIGNPLGELASTLTVGYVSAKDRIVTSEGTQINMLQTDAAINPGNSGGPLFNMKGQVVGITSAKYSGTTDSGATIEGIGFAIPTDDVIMMLEDLRTFGHITGGYLGVTVTEVDQEATELYGLPQGVLVRDVMPGSCAEKAGMRSQDIIINLGGNEVKNLNSLSRALNKCKAGQEVVVTVYRSGSEVDLTVVLDERPQEEAPEVTEPVTTEAYNPWPDDFMDDWFGSFFG